MPVNDPIASAVEAYRRGFTPVALLPGTKRPAEANWTATSYDSEEQLHGHWSELASEQQEPLNVGLALGPKHSGLVDIDLDHPKAARIAHVLLPQTAMRSGREGNPGSHYWFRVTDGYDPGVSRYALPSRSTVVEYRGSGGQTVAPGSIHPDGDLYVWEGPAWGADDGPAEVSGKSLHAHVLLIAILVTLADAWPARGGRHDAYLALAGALLRDADRDGQPRCHPFWDHNAEALVTMLADLTHDGDGARARIAEALPSTRRKISNGRKVHGWPTLAGLIGERHVELVREHVEAVERLDGRLRTRPRDVDSAPESWYEPAGPVEQDETEGEDWSQLTLSEKADRMASVPIEQRDPVRERSNSWEPYDLAPYLIGGVKPMETGILRRTDGPGLLYPGTVNSLYGSAGSGKTFLALQAATDVIAGGGRVLMIDFEDTAQNALGRLLKLGADPALLLERRFAYIGPEEPLAGLQVDRFGQPIAVPGANESRGTLVQALQHLNPDLVIVDGVTSLYGIHGLNTNDAVHTDAVSRWLTWLTDHGERSVLLIDHTAKNSQPGATPMGSQHKLAMVRGVALHVYAITKPRPGRLGKALLYSGKDRHGEVERHGTDEDPSILAEVVYDGTVGDEQLRVLVEPPTKGTVVVPNDGASGKDRGPGRPKADRASEVAKLLEVLRSTGAEMSKVELQMATGLPAYAVSTALHQALVSNQLVRTGAGPATRYELP